ncbi:MAG TPA: NUDIX domain-containing protein [Actinophytocola sp.]|uniref:NUDIX domain-containing protein n=1 Tax=Actinophytocola sp. TaxID=1872138 RepID=UPI002DDD4ED1|nr:NUDIX domain-containing protein [Actinophytocola sp.]HEV2778802.1 NUDIX domain-containing protein [Actinophytocola sp.]
MTGSGVGIIRCVGGIVRDATGRLLLVKRANEPGRGRWSLPGGRVEAGETDADAVVREMVEETGLTVRPGALVGAVERAAPGGVYAIYDYACEVTGGRLRPGDDAADVAWVDAARFAELERAGALSPLLAETLREWQIIV